MSWWCKDISLWLGTVQSGVTCASVWIKPLPFGGRCYIAMLRRSDGFQENDGTDHKRWR